MHKRQLSEPEERTPTGKHSDHLEARRSLCFLVGVCSVLIPSGGKTGSSDLAALGSIRLTAVASNVRPSCRRPYGAGICKGMSCYIADASMCSCSHPTNKNTCEEKCWHQAHPQPILCMALPRGRWHLPVGNLRIRAQICSTHGSSTGGCSRCVAVAARLDIL